MKILYLAGFAFLISSCSQKSLPDASQFTLDHRFAPSRGQTLICMPDETQKTLVDDKGALLYDYFNDGPINGFNIKMAFAIDSTEDKSYSQKLCSPLIPIVITSY